MGQVIGSISPEATIFEPSRPSRSLDAIVKVGVAARIAASSKGREFISHLLESRKADFKESIGISNRLEFLGERRDVAVRDFHAGPGYRFDRPSQIQARTLELPVRICRCRLLVREGLSSSSSVAMNPVKKL
jgi:hypothetical protein